MSTKANTPPENAVALTEAVASLRKQIREAAEQATNLPPNERFRIEKVELELTVVAEDTTNAGGEVGWWIFKAKADVSAKDAITHKVNLTLNVGDVEIGAKTRGA